MKKGAESKAESQGGNYTPTCSLLGFVGGRRAVMAAGGSVYASLSLEAERPLGDRAPFPSFHVP